MSRFWSFKSLFLEVSFESFFVLILSDKAFLESFFLSSQSFFCRLSRSVALPRVSTDIGLFPVLQGCFVGLLQVSCIGLF